MRSTTPTRAIDLKPHHGAPALFVENRPVTPLVADLTAETTAAQIAVCAAVGVPLYRLRGVDLGWLGPGQFDYAPLQARLDILRTADPEARFWLEIRVDAPLWWLEAHPEEAVVNCLPGDSSTLPFVSWASRLWRNEAGNALARLVRAVGTTEGGRRCAGYQLVAGEDGEWRFPHADLLPDVGPRMTEQFRTFALGKYRRNTGLLRKAWFDSRAEFDAISCPSAPNRRKADLGILRNPTRSRRVLDYYECLQEAQNTAALHFCDVARRACEGRALIGLSYVPLFGPTGSPAAGACFPEPVLDSADIDFLANTGPGDGTVLLRAPAGSLSMRGKFLFHALPPDGDSVRAVSLAGTHDAGLILPASLPAEVLRGALRAQERTLNAPAAARKRISQVALIVDPSADLYTAETESGGRWLQRTLLTTQAREFTFLGAPFDVYLLSDLFHPKFPDYKVLIFLNARYLSEAERRRVDARVKRSGQTAVWLWAPGVIGEDGIDAVYGQRLCGQKLRLEPGETSLRVRIVESEDPLTRGLHIGSTFGENHLLAPTVTVSDKSAKRLGGNTANKTVFSVHRFDAWTSVVFGGLPVPANLLRNVLREAGCHLYADIAANDTIVANAGLVALSSERGGVYKISLPGPHDVVDALTGVTVASATTEFSVTLSPAATGYYELRPLPRKRI